MTERISVTVNGTVYDVEIDNASNADGSPIEVRVNGQPYAVQFGRPTTEPVAEQRPPLAPAQPRHQSAARPVAPSVTAGQGQRVTAPMPGKILSVAVKVGDQVQAKDTLCTLEAMKMEMTIAAPDGGTVREVRTQVGENVGQGELLFVLA